MPSVESICSRLWQDPGFRQKWLIGGLIASIPLINLLFAGYVVRYVRQLRRGEEVLLPSWDDWGRLLVDGVLLVLLKIVYLWLPVLVGALITVVLRGLFDLLAMDFFSATLAYLPLTLSVAVGWLLWMAALQHFLTREEASDLLDYQTTLRLAVEMARPLAVPSLAFAGFILIAWPILGFAIFLGLMPVVAYATAVYLKVARAA